MSSNFKYTAGLNNVGSYQVAGAPYVTSSTTLLTAYSVKIQFPYVTSWVKVVNTTEHAGRKLIVALSAYHATASGNAGTTNNLTLMPTSSTGILPWKLSELYVSGSGQCTFEVYAGLTNLPTDRVDKIAPESAGSNWSGSVGVG